MSENVACACLPAFLGSLEAQVNRCSRCLDPHEGSGAFCTDCVQKLRERHLAWSLSVPGLRQGESEDRPGSTVPMLFQDKRPGGPTYDERLKSGFAMLENDE